MKIAYLGQMADVACENGISKKLLLQMNAWQADNHEVRYFALTPTGKLWAGLDKCSASLLRRGNLLSRRTSSQQLCNQIREWKPDLIYFRYAHHECGLPQLFDQFPCIGEINSDDTREYTITLPLYKQLYHKLTRRRVLRKFKALVPVTTELARRMDWLSLPTQVVPNSIDLNSIPPLPALSPDAPSSLFFIGNAGSPWHGLERIGELASIFPSLHFEIVGYNRQDWNRCVAIPPPGNIRLHGMLPYSEYARLLQSATIAIASMALYKNRMDEACPLKTREYLALGLPIIAAYKDSDIPDDAEYFLRLPNDSSSLSPWKEKIEAFIDQWRYRRVPRNQVAHLDVSVKEHQRLAFMQEILERHRLP